MGPWALTRKRSIVPETSSWRTVTGMIPRDIVRIWTITRPTITKPKYPPGEWMSLSVRRWLM